MLLISLLNLFYYALYFIFPLVSYQLFSTYRTFFMKSMSYYWKKWKTKKDISKKNSRNSHNLSEFEELDNSWNNDSTETESITQIFDSIDQQGNSLTVKITQHTKLTAEVLIALRLENGKSYTFPEQNSSKDGFCIRATSLTKPQWKARGLNMETLEPCQRARVTYNGLLINTDGNEQNIQHVQFNFIWNSSGNPLFAPQEEDSVLLTGDLTSTGGHIGNSGTFLKNYKSYTQFGAFQGIVKIEGSADMHLNLACCRSQYRGMMEQGILDDALRIFMATDNGFLINVGIKNLKNGQMLLNYGGVLSKSRDVYHIQNSDLSIDLLRSPTLPSCVTIHLKVDEKQMKCVLHMNKDNILHWIQDDKIGYKVAHAIGDCQIQSMQGKVIIEKWSSHQGSSMEEPAPLLKELKVEKLPLSLITPLSSENAKILEITGGKGNSLALLNSIGSEEFIVPIGFIVTVTAYKAQLNSSCELKQSILSLEEICCEKKIGDPGAACEEVAKLFKTVPILHEISQDVLEQLNICERCKYDDGIPECRWAVRSSAIGEDSEELSAAGQNESILGCVTHQDVLEAITQCWASLFSYQSVQYRRQHGLSIRSEMAVVIQKMVPADAAGVLFTCHPSTGNSALMAITANYGLGESVVSGKADPDTILLSKTLNGTVSMSSYDIGRKNQLITMSKDGVEVLDSTDLTDRLCITTDQALRLGKIGVTLENAFGNYRDIEWAIYKDKIYLLQCRPITTLNVWTDFELLHEFDVPHLSKNDIYTIANIGEVCPGALTVLSQSVSLQIIDAALQLSVTGVINPHKRILQSTHHHAILDVILSIHKQPSEEIELNSKILDLALFGHPVINDTIHQASIDTVGISTALDRIGTLTNMAKHAWFSRSYVNELTSCSAKFDPNLSTDDSAIQMCRTIDKCLREVQQICHYHCLITQTSVFYQIVAINVLAEKNQELTVDHYHDIALLLSSCEDVVSAEVPAMLHKIVTVIIDSGKYEEFRALQPDEALDWLKCNCKEAYEHFQHFLNEHGHRLLGEFELKEDTWAMNPSAVLKMLQMHSNTKSREGKKQLTPEQVTNMLISAKSNITRRILCFIMKKSRKAVGYREQSKSELIRSINKLRIAYRILAQKLVQEGIIPSKTLIYHLTHYEISKIVQTRDPALISKAFLRQRLYSQWNKLRLPEIMYGLPKPEEENSKLISTGSDVICTGTPVCIGDITARACVITSLDEIEELRAGDILITCSTDIGWSPYFPILSGVVTELGGLVSHGAVVAREYGLPCIVGVPNATKIFKTGNMIHLSGKTGMLQLLSEE